MQIYLVCSFFAPKKATSGLLMQITGSLTEKQTLHKEQLYDTWDYLGVFKEIQM